MLNAALFRREMKNSWKLLALFAAILTLYITMIIRMFDPDMAEILQQFQKAMPDLMAAVGMLGEDASLTGFLTSYLYGMILLVFPMLYSILRSNALIAKYVDRGSMAALLSAPVSRSTVVCTQFAVLCTGTILLLVYCTALEMAVIRLLFPEEAAADALLRMNLGLLALQLFLGAFSFLCSCAFRDSRRSAAVGAGVPILMYILQMLANMGGKLEPVKYCTVFTLYSPRGLAAGDANASLGSAVLLFGAFVLFFASLTIFHRKDLPL